MKGTGDLFSKICDMDNLKKAHKNAKKGKGWYREVKQVEKNLDKALKKLQESLIEHTYKTSDYEVFTKRRERKRGRYTSYRIIQIGYVNGLYCK